MSRLRDIPRIPMTPMRRLLHGSRTNAWSLPHRLTQVFKDFDGLFVDIDVLHGLRHALNRVLRDFLIAEELPDRGWSLEPYPLDGRWLLFEERTTADGGVERDERRLRVEPGGWTTMGKDARGQHCFIGELPARLRGSKP